MDIIRIAIDGPSGAGKSTIAKELAKRLKIDYIDTGAMYRAAAYKLIDNNIQKHEVEKIIEMLKNTDIDYSQGNIILDGEIINEKIRTQEISRFASEISAIAQVREILVALQQEMGSRKSIIMDGRDIGTVVLENAEFKFFITADISERANRRWLELKDKGIKTDLETVKKEMEERDFNDINRDVTPLKQAKDAILIDGTNLSVDQTVDKILKLMEDKI